MELNKTNTLCMFIFLTVLIKEVRSKYLSYLFWSYFNIFYFVIDSVSSMSAVYGKCIAVGLHFNFTHWKRLSNLLLK